MKLCLTTRQPTVAEEELNKHLEHDRIYLKQIYQQITLVKKGDHHHSGLPVQGPPPRCPCDVAESTNPTYPTTTVFMLIPVFRTFQQTIIRHLLLHAPL